MNTRSTGALLRAPLFVSTLCGLFSLGSLGASARAESLPAETFTLPNGLRVVLHEDHRLPTVFLRLRYLAGSSREPAQRTGLAHLLEHLLFHGSTHVADPGSEYYRAGARHVNASTDQDFVDCYALLPAANLATGLWIESDRMRFLEPTLSRGDLLKNERSIVKNERRLRLDAGPAGAVYEQIFAALFPPEHPYHHVPVGSMADLDRITAADLRAYYDLHFQPANAALALVGDLDPRAARSLVEKYFGTLPATAPPPAPRRVAAGLREERRVSVADPADRERSIMLAWLATPAYASVEPMALVLKEVLAGRLRRLVPESPLRSATVELLRHQLQSVLTVSLRPRDGVPAEAALQAVEPLLAQLRDEPIADEELAAARAAVRTRALLRLDALPTKADLLLDYLAIFGRTNVFDEEMQGLEQVSGVGVRRFAQAMLRDARRVVIFGNTEVAR